MSKWSAPVDWEFDERLTREITLRIGDDCPSFTAWSDDNLLYKVNMRVNNMTMKISGVARYKHWEMNQTNDDDMFDTIVYRLRQMLKDYYSASWIVGVAKVERDLAEKEVPG